MTAPLPGAGGAARGAAAPALRAEPGARAPAHGGHLGACGQYVTSQPRFKNTTAVRGCSALTQTWPHTRQHPAPYLGKAAQPRFKNNRDCGGAGRMIKLKGNASHHSHGSKPAAVRGYSALTRTRHPACSQLYLWVLTPGGLPGVRGSGKRRIFNRGHDTTRMRTAPPCRAQGGHSMAAIQMGTRVLISLLDSLMFGRVPGIATLAKLEGG